MSLPGKREFREWLKAEAGRAWLSEEHGLDPEDFGPGTMLNEYENAYRFWRAAIQWERERTEQVLRDWRDTHLKAKGIEV